MAAELIFPEQTLILMCSAPGCGKSTFTKRHFLPTQVISSDECRAMVCDDMEDMSVHEETFSLVRHIARLRMGLGKLTVIDTTSLTRNVRSQYQRLAEEYGFSTGIILLDIPLETCLEQNRRRNRQVDPDVIRAFHQSLQKTKKTVREEGFDHLYFLDEHTLPKARVTIRGT
ncbi:putative kinase [Melghirimyces profundicolus]|uniref:Putative kinase n=1 Tax=Melghirimyces profundicolus TaxID=1242148 RepID=A0A2T6C9R5_9BACL|nr:AAA family ATPase [Melghirimyces profundicolus]PTX65042.1 putative kinase [Melghirimyces profundicolus]